MSQGRELALWLENKIENRALCPECRWLNIIGFFHFWETAKRLVSISFLKLSKHLVLIDYRCLFEPRDTVSSAYIDDSYSIFPSSMFPAKLRAKISERTGTDRSCCAEHKYYDRILVVGDCGFSKVWKLRSPTFWATQLRMSTLSSLNIYKFATAYLCFRDTIVAMQRWSPSLNICNPRDWIVRTMLGRS